jgi:hypothetical protein
VSHFGFERVRRIDANVIGITIGVKEFEFTDEQAAELAEALQFEVTPPQSPTNPEMTAHEAAEAKARQAMRECKNHSGGPEGSW